MTEKSTRGVERRRFLKMAGIATAVTGAAVGLAGRDAAAAVPVKDGKAKGQGYRETDLVKRYYALARF